MNHNLQQAAAPQPIALSSQFRDSYFSSAIDLRSGITVNELSLGHLPHDEVAEFLRMRHVWQRH